MMFYDTVIIFDHLIKTIKVVSAAHIQGDRLENAYDSATHKIDLLVERLRKPREDVPE